MKLPTMNEIESLHKKYAPNNEVFQEIWQHCLIVKEIATWCYDHGSFADLDKQLMQAGCLLHDMGVYRLYDDSGNLDGSNYIRHGVLGHELLTEEGLDEVLCRFASHHTGVGITAKEIEQRHLPLPARDYLAETPEERLVMYADKFHSKGPSVFNSAEWFKKHVANKFGPEKVRQFEAMVGEFGLPPIEEMAKQYQQHVRT